MTCSWGGGGPRSEPTIATSPKAKQCSKWSSLYSKDKWGSHPLIKILCSEANWGDFRNIWSICREQLTIGSTTQPQLLHLQHNPYAYNLAENNLAYSLYLYHNPYTYILTESIGCSKTLCLQLSIQFNKHWRGGGRKTVKARWLGCLLQHFV